MRKLKMDGNGTLVVWTASSRVRQGDYGVVRLVGGALKGYLALYDGHTESGQRAIVYPWGPPPKPYIVVRLSSMAQATAEEERRWFEVNATNVPRDMAIEPRPLRLRLIQGGHLAEGG